jgi:hypothetical protein
LQSSYSGLIENSVIFSTKDTFVNSSSGGAAQTNGGQASLTILRKGTTSDKHQRLGLVSFDLSQYVGKQVSEAQLQLYSSSSSNTGRRNPLVVAPIELGNWSESSYSYNTFKSAINVTNDDELLAYVQGISDYSTMPITTTDSVQYGWSSDIAEWINDSLANDKTVLTLMLYTEQDKQLEVNVHAKEASGANAAYRPTLTLTVATSKETLQSLKDLVDTYLPQHYTADTWAALQQVMEQVDEVLDAEPATQSAINDAYSELKQALAALVELKELLDLIVDAEALVANDYTAGSYQVLQDQLVLAQDFVEQSDNANRADVQLQVVALTGAFAQLVDAKALNELIAQLEALDESGYHTMSWNYAQEEVNAAKELLENADATKEEIDASYVHLSAVRVALESYVKLQQKYEQLSSQEMDASNYTAYSYALLVHALQVAEQLLETGDQSAIVIEAALSAIHGAEKKLVSIILLAEVVAGAELLNNEDGQYTVLTWKTFEDRLAAAQQLLQQAGDEEVQISRTAVAYTVNGLIAAQVALLTKLDINNLLNAITGAEEKLSEIVEQDYSVSSWLALTVSYDQAIELRTRALAGDELLVQDELDSAAITLSEQTEALIYVADLYDVIGAASQFEQGRYTSTSWSLLADALQQAQELAAKASDVEQVVSRIEIDEVKQAVEVSILALISYESILTAALAEHDHYVQRDYTTASWSQFTAAKADVQALVVQVSAEVMVELVTDEQVDEAITKLNLAASKLKRYVAPSQPSVPSVDHSSLQLAIAAAAELVETEYTASSWQTFVAVLNEAKAVLADSNATQATINAATASLIAAQQQLQLVTTEEPGHAEQPATPDVELVDVKGHWAQAAINRLVTLGAITGYNDQSFRPENAITRAEFVTIVIKLLALEGDSTVRFEDTKSHWANEYISIAASAGFVNGKTDQLFNPDDQITREEMAVIIGRLMKLTTDTSASGFKDDANISTWAKSAVSAIVAQGIMNGYPEGSFKPTSGATRAEAVTVIIRMLDAMEKQATEKKE